MHVIPHFSVKWNKLFCPRCQTSTIKCDLQKKKMKYRPILVVTCRWNKILEDFLEFGAVCRPRMIKGQGQKKGGNEAQKVVILFDSCYVMSQSKSLNDACDKLMSVSSRTSETSDSRNWQNIFFYLNINYSNVLNFVFQTPFYSNSIDYSDIIQI